jgi:hypothetical protein
VLPLDLGRRGHPYTLDRLRYELARHSLVELVLLFVALLVVLSLFLGVAYLATRAPSEPRSLLHWWHEAFMVLTTIPLADGTAETDDVARRVVQAVTATAGLVLPALFLGSIVFKLLLAPNVFVFRKQIALLDNPAGHDAVPPHGRHLAIRVYSATRLQLLDLRAKVVVQLHSEVSGAGVVAGFREIEVLNPAWPVGQKHLPHTLRVLLEPGDTADVDGEPVLTKICDHAIKTGDRLLVQITGTTPDLGTTFVESHTFLLPDCVTSMPFGPIDAKEGVDSRDWAGWPEFDA